MKIIKQLKIKAVFLKMQITALFYAGRNPDLPWFTRFLVVFTVAYALSPIDLIPDFIPVLGYLDDLILLPLLISLCLRSIPDSIKTEAAAEAERNPLTFKKNWKGGVFVILVWLCILIWIIIRLLL